ncbi:hypothetical protein YC2023_061568 [Brassica napus]
MLRIPFAIIAIIMLLGLVHVCLDLLHCIAFISFFFHFGIGIVICYDYTFRFHALEDIFRKPSRSLKNIAKDEFERNFVSALVAPGEIGVKFDDIGALEHVKKTLNELVILPMRRTELFTLFCFSQPCKGILLFGPPGTEAGANFISITSSSLTSKWFGDAEKLTKDLFSFASKLVPPVIIFVNEVDSLLDACGGSSEHESTQMMRNEFMTAWDGFRSKDSQRIHILGATSRPFDLDRLPRRIYVDLPDEENWLKILNIILNQENIETGKSISVVRCNDDDRVKKMERAVR